MILATALQIHRIGHPSAKLLTSLGLGWHRKINHHVKPVIRHCRTIIAHLIHSCGGLHGFVGPSVSKNTLARKPIAIREMRGQLIELRAGRLKLKNLALGKAVEFARQFKQDSQAWRALCEDPFWKGRKQGPVAARRSDALRFVLRMACGHGPNGLKDANLYLTALGPMMKETKSAKDIAAELTNAGGARKIADALRLSAKPKANTAQAASGSQGSVVSKSTTPDVLVAPKPLRKGDTIIFANLNFGAAKSNLLSLPYGSSGCITFNVTRIDGAVIDLEVTAFKTPSPQDPEA